MPNALQVFEALTLVNRLERAAARHNCDRIVTAEDQSGGIGEEEEVVGGVDLAPMAEWQLWGLIVVAGAGAHTRLSSSFQIACVGLVRWTHY